MHDAVPSTIRAGVASGVSTLSWILFLPFSLLIGWLAREQGVQKAGWVLAGVTLLVGIMLMLSNRRAAVPVTVAASVEMPARQGEVDCVDAVDQVTDYLDDVMPTEQRLAFQTHLAGCDGCTEYVKQVRTTIDALGELSERTGSPS